MPCHSLRAVLLDGEGRDLSSRITHEMLNKQVQPLEKMTARQVVKMQTEIIANLYQKVEITAKAALPDLQAQAQAQLTDLMGTSILCELSLCESENTICVCPYP